MNEETTVQEPEIVVDGVDVTPERTSIEIETERGQMSQLQADNTIPPPRFSRHQMMLQTKRDNPELAQNSNLFRECFVLNAMNQEGPNLSKLANFTGMSKGEVRRHITNIGLKIRAAQMQTASEQFGDQITEAIENYQPGETNADSTTPTNETTGDVGSETSERPGSIGAGVEDGAPAVEADSAGSGS